MDTKVQGTNNTNGETIHPQECDQKQKSAAQILCHNEGPQDAAKTRPIVSVSGTLLENLGVWVDCKLQAFLPMFDSYFKSSTKLKNKMMSLELPSSAQLFTANAISMYTNIPTDIALAKITQFLRHHKQYKDERHPYSAIIDGLEIIMRRCAFTFGDTFWLQRTGTAMGSPPAPAYATIYFGLQEQQFLCKYKSNLFFYRQFINGMIGIWMKNEFNNNNGISINGDNATDGSNDTIIWDRFVDDLNSAAGLTWDVNKPTQTVNFMDLTISIVNNQITTTLFEKQSNRHLYIPSHSSHPPGVINGIVHGMIRRIYSLC